MAPNTNYSSIARPAELVAVEEDKPEVSRKLILVVAVCSAVLFFAGRSTPTAQFSHDEIVDSVAFCSSDVEYIGGCKDCRECGSWEFNNGGCSYFKDTLCMACQDVNRIENCPRKNHVCSANDGSDSCCIGCNCPKLPTDWCMPAFTTGTSHKLSTLGATVPSAVPSDEYNCYVSSHACDKTFGQSPTIGETVQFVLADICSAPCASSMGSFDETTSDGSDLQYMDACQQYPFSILDAHLDAGPTDADFPTVVGTLTAIDGDQFTVQCEKPSFCTAGKLGELCNSAGLCQVSSSQVRAMEAATCEPCTVCHIEARKFTADDGTKGIARIPFAQDAPCDPVNNVQTVCTECPTYPNKNGDLVLPCPPGQYVSQTATYDQCQVCSPCTWCGDESGTPSCGDESTAGDGMFAKTSCAMGTHLAPTDGASCNHVASQPDEGAGTDTVCQVCTTCETGTTQHRFEGEFVSQHCFAGNRVVGPDGAGTDTQCSPCGVCVGAGSSEAQTGMEHDDIVTAIGATMWLDGSLDAADRNNWQEYVAGVDGFCVIGERFPGDCKHDADAIDALYSDTGAFSRPAGVASASDGHATVCDVCTRDDNDLTPAQASASDDCYPDKCIMADNYQWGNQEQEHWLKDSGDMGFAQLPCLAYYPQEPVASMVETHASCQEHGEILVERALYNATGPDRLGRCGPNVEAFIPCTQAGPTLAPTNADTSPGFVASNTAAVARCLQQGPTYMYGKARSPIAALPADADDFTQLIIPDDHGLPLAEASQSYDGKSSSLSWRTNRAQTYMAGDEPSDELAGAAIGLAPVMHPMYEVQMKYVPPVTYRDVSTGSLVTDFTPTPIDGCVTEPPGIAFCPDPNLKYFQGWSKDTAGGYGNAPFGVDYCTQSFAWDFEQMRRDQYEEASNDPDSNYVKCFYDGYGDGAEACAAITNDQQIVGSSYGSDGPVTVFMRVTDGMLTTSGAEEFQQRCEDAGNYCKVVDKVGEVDVGQAHFLTTLANAERRQTRYECAYTPDTPAACGSDNLCNLDACAKGFFGPNCQYFKTTVACNQRANAASTDASSLDEAGVAAGAVSDGSTLTGTNDPEVIATRSALSGKKWFDSSPLGVDIFYEGQTYGVCSSGLPSCTVKSFITWCMVQCEENPFCNAFELVDGGDDCTKSGSYCADADCTQNTVQSGDAICYMYSDVQMTATNSPGRDCFVNHERLNMRGKAGYGLDWGVFKTNIFDPFTTMLDGTCEAPCDTPADGTCATPCPEGTCDAWCDMSSGEMWCEASQSCIQESEVCVSDPSPRCPDGQSYCFLDGSCGNPATDSCEVPHFPGESSVPFAGASLDYQGMVGSGDGCSGWENPRDGSNDATCDVQALHEAFIGTQQAISVAGATSSL